MVTLQRARLQHEAERRNLWRGASLPPESWKKQLLSGVSAQCNEKLDVWCVHTMHDLGEVSGCETTTRFSQISIS